MLSTARNHVLHHLKRVNNKAHITRNFNASSCKSFVVKNGEIKENARAIHQNKSKLVNHAIPSAVTNAAALSSRPRGEERVKPNLKVGDIVHNYQVIEITPIPERNLTAYRLTHLPTGADHLHIDCADTNNAFCVSFKTIPRDSTGVAHILEHTTLCGSHKYPVRDPFFNMIKRSLNTYMNAWTGADYTSYPFSTQNEKDFNNLLSVYLDATFFPQLEKHDFLQEGHRFEFDDSTSNLMYKGVVYNEMKGSMSDPSNFFAHRLTESMYPGTTYSHNSGGEPKIIPNLSYEQLIQFHQIHYHPSNARFITYGDLPLNQHLEFIHENALKKFQKIDPKTDVNLVTRYSSPQRIEMYGPPQAMAPEPDKQTKMSVAVLTSPVTDTLESFYLSMLSSLLLHGPNAPMYKALIDSNIGQSYAPATGHETHGKEAFFSIGLQGIHKGDVEKVEKIIEETLKKSAEEGFDPERIESLLHQIEINQNNVTTSFGMQIISGITHPWHHGSNPIPLLQLNMYIEKMRQDLAKGPLFQNLIKKYFLNNPHKVTFILHPDFEYMQKETESEKKKLAHIQSTMSPQEKHQIQKIAKELKERQEQKQDVNVLPTVTISDIPRETPKVEIRKQANTWWIPQPTNGLAFFRTLVPIPSIPEDLIPYLPLFTTALTSMGTEKRDYRSLAHEIERYTGGLSASISLNTNPHDLQKLEGHLLFSTMSLERNIAHMFELLTEIVTKPNFENQEYLRTLILQRTASLQDSLIADGHAYAQTYSAAPFRKSARLIETWNGISQIGFIQALSTQENLNDIVDKLKQIAQLILSNSAARVMVTAEERVFPALETHVNNFLSFNKSLSNPATNLGNGKETSSPTKTFFTFHFQVNYVAKSFETVPFIHQDSPTLQILARLLSRVYLHREIREKGGAYGGGVSSHVGLWQFYSYRDPHVANTLQTFNNSFDWLKTNEFTDQDVEEAKLTVFADLDAPVAPSDKGFLEFTKGITWEMRQKRREEYFKVTRKELQDVAEKYFAGKTGSIAVVGSEEAAQLLKEDTTWEFK